jgi:osmotically-inducible protein OsmY
MSACGLKRILAVAEHALQERLASASRQIACEFHEGSLILRGRLSSFYEKQLAQEALRRLAGVDQIVNQIEVVATI